MELNQVIELLQDDLKEHEELDRLMHARYASHLREAAIIDALKEAIQILKEGG